MTIDARERLRGSIRHRRTSTRRAERSQLLLSSTKSNGGWERTRETQPTTRRPH